MNKAKKTTIQDLAKYSNVSVGTIDRVLHNRGKVSPDKKKKIEEAIEYLNFNPNFLASTLALGKQFVICSLLPEARFSEKYWSLPKKGIEKVARDYKDFGVIVDPYEYSLFDESSFVVHAKTIIDKNPDGVILAPLFEKESLEMIELMDDKGIPYVFIDENISGQNPLSYIGPDSQSSGYIAGKLLNSISNPEDDLLIVNMVKGVENSSHVGILEKGFFDFFNSLGNKKSNTVHSLSIHSTDYDDVARELTKYYQEKPQIKGVFVTTSKAHFISKFHKKNHKDINVIGFDLIDENVAELKNHGIMFLISQSPIFQGTRAVQTLFDFFINKKRPSKIQYVPIDIILKENVDFYLNTK
ncbi:MAG: LacI family transcriptional regulator [Cyclobacteriaceae bacterium]|jgi:LacI family transcriptional regulator|nr:LacI family transcriptional regulator [Cyclobacteriaceae bacterium]